jgi:hypothetical protein
VGIKNRTTENQEPFENQTYICVQFLMAKPFNNWTSLLELTTQHGYQNKMTNNKKTDWKSNGYLILTTTKLDHFIKKYLKK